MTTPISRERELTPKSLGSPPRLRPAQAAPIRREPSGREMTPGGGGCMDGITTAYDNIWFERPFADDDAD